MKKLQKWIAVALLLTAAVAAFPENRLRTISRNLDIYNSVFRELEMNYVDTIDVDKTVRTSLDEMLNDLDPYTVYIPENERDDFKLMLTGEYGGIGAVISQQKKQILVAEPYEGKPAERAGLRAGDAIMAVDGQKIEGKTVSEVSALLKGTPKTKVKVTLERAGKPFTTEIVREQIHINPVVYSGVIGTATGYVYLSSFSEGAAKELKKVLTDLKKNHAIQSLVLDLRDNPGGSLDEAIDVCNLFVPQGVEIVTTRGKKEKKTYKTSREPFDTDIPLAILVSNGSASASEIVAGAMQDLDRAVIIGNRTFGKGLVQSTRPVSYNGLLKITTAKYYIPSGRCIQAIDYSHRNTDGSAAAIPDSLTQEFRTAKGRIVRDGGGIKPDVETAAPRELNISYRLVADSWIFNYATLYVQKHPTIAPIEDFALTEADYENFKNYLKENNFTYTLKSADLFKRLKEIVSLEGYGEVAKDELVALEQKLTPDRDKDLDLFKKDVLKMLNAEIAKRYYYQKGEIIQQLKDDEASQKAIELLKNGQLIIDN